MQEHGQQAGDFLPHFTPVDNDVDRAMLQLIYDQRLPDGFVVDDFDAATSDGAR